MSDAYGLRYQERLDSTADEAVRRAMNNGEYSRPTERMKSAALEFAKALMDDYRVWECEPTGKVIQYSKEEAEKIAGNTSDNRRKK